MKNDVNYRNELLTTWEDTYKKGQLTLWIFLALKDGPKYVNEIRDFILEYSEGTISCEEQSLYRALRKFNHLKIVGFSSGKGHKGPDRKYYELTEIGVDILSEFISRNIKLFFNKKLVELMNLK